MARYIKFAGFGFALLVAALFGAVAVSTVSAEGPFPPAPSWTLGPGTDRSVCPFGGCPAPTEAPDAQADPGAVDAPSEGITCSLTEGCEIEVTFVTDDGEEVKTLVITLVDEKVDEAPASD